MSATDPLFNLNVPLSKLGMSEPDSADTLDTRKDELRKAHAVAMGARDAASALANLLADYLPRVAQPIVQQHLEQLAVKSREALADLMASGAIAPIPPIGDPLAASQPAYAYATASQKEEIIRLLNHPLITRQEKTKMLLNINRLDEERATQAIAKLRKAIEDRAGTSAIAA